VLLVRYVATGEFGGDTWHATVDEAKGQGEYEFGAISWHTAPSEPAPIDELAVALLAAHRDSRGNSAPITFRRCAS
jgi:hypothetical protein